MRNHVTTSIAVVCAATALALTFGFPASAQFTNADGSPVYSSSFPAQWDGNVLATVWQGSREFRTDNLQNLPANAPDSSNVSFLPAVTYSTGDHNPYAIAIADVNEDGKPDLIVGNHGSQNAEGSVAVLLGNGDGTFGAAVDYDSGGITAYSVVVADINGDSKPDLVVADGCAGNDCSTGAIGVLLGNGDGTFRPALVYKVVGGPSSEPASPSPTSMETATWTSQSKPRHPRAAQVGSSACCWGMATVHSRRR